MEDTILSLGFSLERSFVKKRIKGGPQGIRLWFWYGVRQFAQMRIEKLKHDVSIDKATSDFLFLDEGKDINKKVEQSLKVPISTMEVYGDF